ncbi:MAG TPA: Rieske 2Fe-2S domain-containing protein [Streptosporangiaceae bacterium]|nr:Rieske 2Fe-2S domain-containing protein [Streptosporangiaceae bacterium]
MGRIRFLRISDTIERAGRLDSVVSPIQRIVRRIPPGRFRDTLHGVWLGHPLHPLLVQVPVGAWMSAAFLDASGDGERQARQLIGAGLLASVPAALAGSADWSEQHEQQMRVGVVHAAANTTAIALYAGSLLARLRQRPALGKALSYAGLAAVTAGGMLGGDISYRQAGGANHAEEIPHLVEPGWHDLMPLASLEEGKASKATLGEVPLLVVRAGTQVHVLAGKCAHMSGPLSDGQLAEGCVTCPWHGSVFRLADGSVARGPATAPQPAFETRVREGIVQVCLPGAG